VGEGEGRDPFGMPTISYSRMEVKRLRWLL